MIPQTSHTWNAIMTLPHKAKVTPPTARDQVSKMSLPAIYLQAQTYVNALLLSDLSTNVGTGVEVDRSNEVDKTTQATAITYRLCSLAKHVARAKVGDDA